VFLFIFSSSTVHGKQAYFEKIVRPRPAYRYSIVTYIMEYAFTFTFASRQPDVRMVPIVCDIINLDL